uniref:Putative ovule protein n=1 Tax=Solanum chacoense TaxID=4108 RepID=A0A0V0GTR3_SOLCH
MLVCCQGISKCHICGLVHLKYFDASYCKLHSVIVQAPYLQCFRYTEPTEQDNLLPREIAILDGYNTLQTLELTGASITDQQFRDVSYKFPNISELELKCFKLKI